MPGKKSPGELSPPVIQRLSEYLLILEQFIKEEREVVSSRALADVYGNNSSQVRHDIFQIEHKGSLSHGYLCSNSSTTSVLPLTCRYGQKPLYYWNG